MASASHRVRTLPALLSLLLHAVVAVLVLRALPQGFSGGHLRFWSNTAIPVLMGLVSVLGLVGFRRPTLFTGILWSLAGLWLAGGVVASLLFPRSLPLAWLGGVGGAVVLGGLARLAWRHSWLRVGGLLLLGVVPGAILSLAQRAPASSTRPLNADIPVVMEGGWAGGGPTWKSSNGRVSTSLDEARVRVECGGLVLQVHPLLTFISRSPDRFWSNLAPRKTNEVRRRLTGIQWTAQSVQAVFRDDGVSTLQLLDRGDSVELEAFSLLRASVFSHLNSYLAFEIEARPGLALEFSAAPGQPVEILPSQYPVGLPVRAAYLTSDQVLRIVEASTGEKGPFRTLREGRLEAEGALALTIHDSGGPACRIELLDWAAQASTALSPTAGWGLPQNAIEFHRTRTDATAPAEVFLTLAGTSLGRGWDTVGHAPGTYRNRMRIHSLRGEAGGGPHGVGLSPLQEGPPMLPHAVEPRSSPQDAGSPAPPH
ncbi:hypothetical protein [Hyalangium gracile]|uniref:hypothetical protein n=1 Tax=Hyalangium gracile TaxID=394092 RepID=UPI001CC99658|nr:hypothetical protein [Hyalangium gracile]